MNHDFPIMKFFQYSHLPPKLQEISKPFCDLAEQSVQKHAGSTNPAELVAGLRKLLEAKDCIVRAALP